MNELDGLCLSPIIGDDCRLVFVLITFQNAPGLELRLTASAAAELRDGLTMTIDRAPVKP